MDTITGTKTPDLSYADLRVKYDHNRARTRRRAETYDSRITTLYAPAGQVLGYVLAREDGTVVGPFATLTTARAQAKRDACRPKGGD